MAEEYLLSGEKNEDYNAGADLKNIAKGINNYADLQGAIKQGYSLDDLWNAAQNARDWDTASYLRFLSESQDEARSQGFTDSNMDQAGIFNRGRFRTLAGGDLSVRGSYETGMGYYLAQLPDIYNQVKDDEDAATKDSTTYKYERPKEVQDVLDELNKVTEPGDFVAPEFNPDTVKTWLRSVQEMDQPGVDYSLKKLNEQYNASNPYGYGSGSQLKLSEGYLAEVAKDQANRATAMAASQNDKDYQIAFAKWQKDYAKWEDAINKKIGISQFETGADQFGSTQKMQDKWHTQQLDFSKSEGAADRAYGLAQTAINNAFTQQIAETMKPKTPGFLDYAAAFLGPAVSAFTGQAGLNLANGLFSPKSYTSSPMASSNLNLYDFTKPSSILGFR